MKKENLREVKGDMFVIPNPAGKFGEFITSTRKTMKDRLRRLVGIDNVVDEDVMIEVWMTSDVCDNWASQYGGLQRHLGIELNEREKRTEDDYTIGYFPKFLPLKVLEGKKEGDVLRLHCPEYNVDILLTLNQHGYRYKRYGNFESAVADVLDWSI